MDWRLTVIFLHLTGVFIFLLAHGTSVSVSFRLKREVNPDRIRALLDLSVQSFAGMGVGLVLLLISGIVGGFIGNYWGRGWIWAAIVILILVSAGMTFFGSMFYTKVRAAVGVPPYKQSDQQPLGAAKDATEIAALLNTNQPILLSIIGFGGILIILWLMIFKPF